MIESIGLPYEGIIKNFRVDTGTLLAVVEERKDDKILESWYPIKEDEFKEGEQVVITPHIKIYPSGGSLTTYKLRRKTTPF